MKWFILLTCWAILTVTILAVVGKLKHANVQLGFYARIPILAGLGLAIVGPIAIFSPLRHLMGNAFLVYGFWQLTITAGICMLASFLFGSIYRNIEFNGRERFLGIKLNLDLAKRGAVSDGSEEVAANNLMGHVRSIFFEPFGAKSWGRLRTVWHLILVFLVGISAPACCLIYSLRHEAWKSEDAGWGIMAILLGVLLAVAFLALEAYLTNLFAPTRLQIPAMNGFDMRRFFGQIEPSDFAKQFGNAWAYLTRGPGYASEDPSNPGTYLSHPGHVQLAMATGIMALVYLLVFWLSSSALPYSQPERALPTVAYVVFVLSFVTSILSFTAFLLDYYHIPPSLALGVILILVYSSPKHSPASFLPVRSAGGNVSEPPKLFDALSRRIEHAEKWPVQTEPPFQPGRRERVLIVVTAPGGGIHAAAWTARVLTGMQERYGEVFNDSLGIVSGISGGGMGSLIYVDALARDTPAAVVSAMENVNKIAQASSLDAVAWGIAFPDLIRAVNPLPWSPQDRGRVLEQTWEARLDHSGTKSPGERSRTLGSLAQKCKKGEIPLIVWSTTDVVSGQRVVIAPIADAISDERTVSGVSHTETAVDLYRFLRLWGGKDQPLDLSTSTAARLAATFPYVTPIVGMDLSAAGSSNADAHTTTRLSQLRCIDGGYFDNEGLVTAVRWIARFIEELESSDGPPRPVDKILLLRIEPNPPLAASARDAALAASDSGLDPVMSALGPILALASVRSASQAERGNLEAELLERASIDRSQQAKELQDLLLQQYGLSMDDLQMLWKNDWKESLFGAHVNDAEFAKSRKILAAAIKIALPDDKKLRKFSQGILSSDAIEKGTRQLSELFAHHSLPVEQTFTELTNTFDRFKPQQLGQLLNDKTHVVSKSLELLRGRSRIDEVRQILVKEVTVPFINPDQDPPPLSWALSPKETKKYDDAWNTLLQDADSAKPNSESALTVLDQIFVAQKKANQ